MRDVFPIKYYSEEGFVERKIEINEEDLEEIIEDYLTRKANFDFDEIEIVNNRPMNIWLYAKCRKYVHPDNPEEDLCDGEYDYSILLLLHIKPLTQAQINNKGGKDIIFISNNNE